MKNNRAYSLLSIKAVNEDKREFTGIASSPETDRMGDIVEPDGAVYELPIPLLWQHDDCQPIGEVIAAQATKNGIQITARIATAPNPGTLNDRLNEAWDSIKIGLVKGLSIGFRPIEYSYLDGGGMRFTEWDWLELSAVTIPANVDATITAVKSYDAEARAAMGAKVKAVKAESPSGASEKKSKPTSTVKLTPKEGTSMKIPDQIKQFQNERAAKTAKMEAIMKASADAGESLPEDKAEEFDTLQKEVDGIDKHLDRLESLQKAQARSAKAIEEVDTTEKGAAARSGGSGPTILIRKNQEEKFKGQNFTRIVIAKALARLNDVSPSAIAAARWGKTNPTLVEIIKANEVAGGGSASGEWGAELVLANNQYIGDFIEYLNSKTVFDKLPLREVPANITIKGQDGAASGYWVGQGKGIPVSKADFSNVSLTPLKVAALATVSNELLRDSSPAAEALVRDALIEASAQKIDTTLFSTAAASAGVSPAGLLHSVVAKSTAGADGDGLIADVKALYADFIAAKNATGLYFVMNPALAKAISLMRNALGQVEFPGITADGGNLLGDPVVTGDNIGSSELILLKPSDIYEIGDTGIEVSISRDAMIEQNSAPTGDAETPASASQDMVSMFQSEMTAIKVVRPINFAKRRASAVGYVSDADYGNTASG